MSNGLEDTNNSVWTAEDVIRFSDSVLSTKTDDFQKGKALFWNASSQKVLCKINIKKYLDELNITDEEERIHKQEERMQIECKKIFDPLYRSETFLRDSAYVDLKERELFLSKVLYTIGEILVELKDHDNASRSFKDSYKIYKKYNDMVKMASIKRLKVESCLATNRMEDAETHATDSLEFNLEINNEKGILISNFYLWKINLKKGNIQEALKFYESALKYADFKSQFIQEFILPAIREEQKQNTDFIVPQEIQNNIAPYIF